MIAPDRIDPQQRWREEHPIPFAAAAILAAACPHDVTPHLRFEDRRIVARLAVGGADLFAVRRGERHLARLYLPLPPTPASRAWLEERGASFVHWVEAEASFTFLMSLDDVARQAAVLLDRLTGAGNTAWDWLETVPTPLADARAVSP